MIEKINTIKQDKFFKTEQLFFRHHKKVFVLDMVELLHSDIHNVVNDFYDALFNFKTDCYEKQLYCIDTLNKSDLSIDTIFSILAYRLIKAFADYKKHDTSESITKLIYICSSFQAEIVNTISNKPDTKFDVAPLIKKKKNIKYLFDICRLGEDIKFISYKKPKTNIQNLEMEQVGKNSLIIKTTKEHIEALKKSSNSFMVIERMEKEYFSTSAKFFYNDDNSVILENIKKLESQPLLSRKYPRASIVHNSIIQITNQSDNITGNLIDISEGGMGVLSSTKTNLEKGQDITVLVSYEDKENDINLNFESDGILTSIIGKKHAFRYGVKLMLSAEKRELVGRLVENINKRKNLVPRPR